MIIAGSEASRAYVSAAGSDAAQQIYVISGQSNAEGRGLASDLPALPSDISQPSTGTRWRYRYSASDFNSALSPVAPIATLHGLEPSLAHALESRGRTGDVLVNVSTGGLGIDNWNAGVNLYEPLVDYSLSAMSESGISPVHTFIWWQGEKDAQNSTLAANYQTRLNSLISRLRVSLASPSMRVLVMRLRSPSPYTYGATVRAAEAAVAAADPLVSLVDIDDLPTEATNVHYTSAGQISAGERVAERVTGISHYRGVSGCVGQWQQSAYAAADNGAWHSAGWASNGALTVWRMLYDGADLTQSTGALSTWVDTSGNLLSASPSAGATFILDAAPSVQDIARLKAWCVTTLGVAA